MTTLTDNDIRAWALAGGINPYAPELVNPASINLTIGDVLIVESPSGGTYEVDISTDSQAHPFMVKPGEWILAHTAELITLGSCLEAEVCLRSSAARAGWNHALAGYVDPGWGLEVGGGRLTLEFQNVRRFASLPIYPGLQLVQLRLRRLSGPPSADYSQTGRYNGDKTVQGNKDEAVG